MPADGLDDLERRGRWSAQPRSQPTPQLAPKAIEPTRVEPTAPTKPIRRKSAAKAPTIPKKSRVERVVLYLSQAQTEWIREQQIEGLRKRKRVSASQLIRDLIDKALSQRTSS
jgi:hypothetical protein